MIHAATNRRRFRCSLLGLLAAAAVLGTVPGRCLHWAGAVENANATPPAEFFQNSLAAGDRAAGAMLDSLPDHYAVDPYLQAAVEIQAMPAAGAADLLLAMAQRDPGNRTIILSRLLFTAKPAGKFRFPANRFSAVLGGAGDADWPLAPLALIDGVPLLIARPHAGVAGQLPESAESYVRDCLQACNWTPIRYKAKTAAEKEAALAKLLASSKWTTALDPADRKFLSAQIEPPARRL